MTFIWLLLLYTVYGLFNCVGANECPNGTYGLNCLQPCGHCRDNEPCNYIDGTCPNGCQNGFLGSKCIGTCITDLYGIHCPVMCSKNCADTGMCSKITGECEKGCQAGWRGLTCEEKCPEGTFGLNCSEMCGYCRNNEPCHRIYGTCLTGCEIGFRGSQCKHACTESHFGYDCLRLCSSNCAVSGECDPVTGECIKGCQDGWKGPMCDQIYEQDSFFVPESKSHPTVLIFVFVAFFSVSFIITVVLLIGIRKARMQKKQEMQEKVAIKWDERGKYPFTI